MTAVELGTSSPTGPAPAGVRRGHLDPRPRGRHRPALRGRSATGSPAAPAAAAVGSAIAGVLTSSGEFEWPAVRRRGAHGGPRRLPSSPLNTTVSRGTSGSPSPRPTWRTTGAAVAVRLRHQRRRAVRHRRRLRNWLLSRGEPVTPTATVRAMAPGCRCTRPRPGSARPGRANRSARWRPSWSTCRSARATPSCGSRRSRTPPNRTPRPPAWSTRAASSPVGFARRPCTPWGSGGDRLSARLFNVLVTNVPGRRPDVHRRHQLLWRPTQLPPLLANQVLAIGVTSYCGMLYFGINADRRR